VALLDATIAAALPSAAADATELTAGIRVVAVWDAPGHATVKIWNQTNASRFGKAQLQDNKEPFTWSASRA
jgi:hypothetical protein